MKRRDLLLAVAGAGAAAVAVRSGRGKAASPASSRRSSVIASGNGERVVGRAQQLLSRGADPMEAVVSAVAVLEDDPDEMTVGLGGVPNEEGEVELDASVMDGRTMKSGAVGALRRIRRPSAVARLVMEHTTRAMLVGEGALKFARANGFPEENLLTERARKVWLYWKQNLATHDDWIEPERPETDPDLLWFFDHYGRSDFRSQGTVHCAARTAAGDFVGCTSTSGLFFKLPGRLGDSPIIGAGLYVDNEVGSCGSTGWGEANIRTCGSYAVVSEMRAGAAPEEAALAVLRRQVKTLGESAFRDPSGRPKNGVTFYALAKDGRFGGAATWSGKKFWVHDGTTPRKLDCGYLFKRPNA